MAQASCKPVSHGNALEIAELIAKTAVSPVLLHKVALAATQLRFGKITIEMIDGKPTFIDVHNREKLTDL